MVRVSSYDGFGNVIEYSDAEGRFGHYAWNDFGAVNVAIDGEGNAWRYEYDVNGNLISALDPEGNETRLDWTESGQPSSLHFADGTREQRFYDAHHRLIRIVDAGGSETSLARDVFGRVVASVAPDGSVTRFDYGASKGKDFYTPATIERPDGVRIERQFDGEGQIAHVRDGQGRQWHYHYGPFDQLVGIEEPGGGKLSFSYDVLKRLTQVTDAHGKKWVFERDGAGRVIREVDFSGQVFDYSYDITGNVTKRTHTDGSYIEYAYDKTGLLLEERSFGSAGNPEDRSHYRYDRRGLLKRAENNSALVTFSRDKLGRITQEGLNGRIVKSSFDAMGRRISQEIEGHQVEALYDPLGQIAQLVIGAHQPLEFTRDVMGREVLRRSSQGFQLEQSYDPVGQLLHQKAGFALSSLGKGLEGMMAAQTRGLKPQALSSQVERHYCWNAAFEPTHIKDKRWGETSYNYDDNGQIISAQFGDGAGERFHYDAARNISGFGDVGNGVGDVGGIIHQWQHQAGGVVTKARGPGGEVVELDYDERNRVISRKVSRNGFRPKLWRYEWDAKDRLIATLTPEGERWTYSYDPFGRRVFKINSGAAKASLAADSPVRLAENQTRGAFYVDDTRTYPQIGEQIIVGTAYLWDGDVMAQEAPMLADGTAVWEQATHWHYEPGGFKPIAKQTPDGALFYIVTDHLGTPREMFSEDGQLGWAAQYRTWGGVKHIWQADNDNNAYTSSSPNHPSPAALMRGSLAIRYDTVAEQRSHAAALDCPIRFQGQWEDGESGLYYNRHRYYDPLTGQYLSPDPIGIAGGTRPNSYVHNPNTYIDPLGLAPKNFPRGFRDRSQYDKAMQELKEAAVKDGISDAQPGVRGSSVTGRSHNKPDRPFDGGTKPSDIDAFIQTDSSLSSFNKNGFAHPDKVARNFPNLKAWGEKWSNELGREVTPAIWKNGQMPDHGQMFWP